MAARTGQGLMRDCLSSGAGGSWLFPNTIPDLNLNISFKMQETTQMAKLFSLWYVGRKNRLLVTKRSFNFIKYNFLEIFFLMLMNLAIFAYIVEREQACQLT